MNVVPNATRKFRSQMKRGVYQGHYKLRVVNTGKGYRLGAERGQSIILFGSTYAKESKAVVIGNNKYKQRASRVVLKKAA